MHTPGPWEVYAQFNIRSTAVNRDVGNCGGPHDGRVEDGGFAENCANAHLIAAAPELLAACQAYSDYCDPTTTGEPVLIRIREQIRAAIAKATGAA